VVEEEAELEEIEMRRMSAAATAAHLKSRRSSMHASLFFADTRRGESALGPYFRTVSRRSDDLKNLRRV